jgi:hypothetical protein
MQTTDKNVEQKIEEIKEIAKDEKSVTKDLKATTDDFSSTTRVIKIISVITAILIFFYSKYVFIFFLIAMTPSITAIILDRRNNKCPSATICSFNMIGAIPYLFEMWHSKITNDVAKRIINDIDTWICVYGFAFFGLVCILLLPNVISYFYVAKTYLYIKKLEIKRQAIADEWSVEFGLIESTLKTEKLMTNMAKSKENIGDDEEEDV